MHYFLVILMFFGLYLKPQFGLSGALTKEEFISKAKAMQNYIQIWGFVKYHQINLKKDLDKPFLGAIHFLNQKKALSKTEYNLLINQFLLKNTDLKSCGKNFNGSLKNHLYEGFLDDRNKVLLRQWHEKFSNADQVSNVYVKANSNGGVLFTNEKIYADSAPLILEYRILSIARYYNAVKYYYPYLARNTWDELLEKYLSKAFFCKSIKAYHLLMLEYAASIKDSNGSIALGLSGSKTLSKKWGSWHPPVEIFCRGDSVFINRSLRKQKKQRTDLYQKKPIETINNVKISYLIDSLSGFINASNPLVKQRDITALITRGSKNSTLLLGYKGGAEIKLKRTLKVNDALPFDCFYHGESAVPINDSILLVNWALVNNRKKMQAVLNKWPNVHCLVFDLTKNYKAVSDDFWNVFELKKGVKHTQTGINLKCPGEETTERNIKELVGDATSAAYKGAIYIVISEFTQNATEDFCMKLKTIKRSTILGRPSAGAQGEVAKIDLVGGFSTCFTSTVSYYDNERFPQSGIVPEILLPMLHLDEKIKVLQYFFSGTNGVKEEEEVDSSGKNLKKG